MSTQLHNRRFGLGFLFNLFSVIDASEDLELIFFVIFAKTVIHVSILSTAPVANLTEAII